MLINTVNEGAIEIEKKRRDGVCSSGLWNYTHAAVALRTGAKTAVSAVLHSSAAEHSLSSVSPECMFLVVTKCFYTQFAVFFAEEMGFRA